VFRGHNEIAFILSVFIIDHYDYLASPYSFDRIFYCG
jgi:hypothetical protein